MENCEPGGTIIEATAGNTGLGLALIAGAKGYRVPSRYSRQDVAGKNRARPRARRRGAADAFRRDARSSGILSGRGGSPGQRNSGRHSTSISSAIRQIRWRTSVEPVPEIWEQMGHHLDAVVVGVGSGGTLTGLGRFFERVQPNLEMILADPTGSILYEWVKTGKLEEAGSWAVEGIGEDFIPDIADMSFVTDAFEIDDAESFEVARELLRKEGILGGSSTGTLLAGALRYCRQQTKKTGRYLRLRHGQQISLEDVQRLLDGRAGIRHRPCTAT